MVKQLQSLNPLLTNREITNCLANTKTQSLKVILGKELQDGKRRPVSNPRLVKMFKLVG